MFYGFILDFYLIEGLCVVLFLLFYVNYGVMFVLYFFFMYILNEICLLCSCLMSYCYMILRMGVENY